MNQVKYSYLNSIGFRGSLNKMLLDFYRSMGAVGSSLVDLEMAFLTRLGYISGAIQDRWAKYVQDLGYKGALQDSLTNIWKNSEFTKTLFASNEQGAWYDPSDLSTMWQDSAGTTPVTAMEQPVGLMLDKSGRGNHARQATTTKRPVLSRRVNLLTKTEQFDDAAWSKSASGLAIAPVVTPNAAMAPDGTMTADVVVFDLNGGATGGDFSQLAQTPGHDSAPYSWSFWAKTSDGTTKTLTVVDVAGGARTVTVTGSYQRIEVSATGSAFPRMRLRGGEGTSSYASICLWGASLTLATDAHLPYQWVNTATDYDADPSKFPAYLRFDGVDDALSTGSIDFTSTDKMTVFAGATKLSDAVQVIAETSHVSTSVGAFGLLDSAASSPSSIGFRSQSAYAGALANNFAPVSYSASASADRAAPQIIVRQSSVQVASTSASHGTGNYGNYPLYIGARAGTSNYFNGRLYGLIVRGAQTPLSQIEATELYIKQKMRMP